MRWTYNKEELPDGVHLFRIGRFNNILNISVVNMCHAGIYKCFGKDSNLKKYFVAQAKLDVIQSGK